MCGWVGGVGAGSSVMWMGWVGEGEGGGEGGGQLTDSSSRQGLLRLQTSNQQQEFLCSRCCPLPSAMLHRKSHQPTPPHHCCAVL